MELEELIERIDRLLAVTGRRTPRAADADQVAVVVAAIEEIESTGVAVKELLRVNPWDVDDERAQEALDELRERLDHLRQHCDEAVQVLWGRVEATV